MTFNHFNGQRQRRNHSAELFFFPGFGTFFTFFRDDVQQYMMATARRKMADEPVCDSLEFLKRGTAGAAKFDESGDTTKRVWVKDNIEGK